MSLLGLSAYDSSGSDEETESPASSKTASTKKTKVKIIVPLATAHSSDEEDEPPAKKPSVGSGLFSKLPAPRNTVGGGKQVNRTLIPHVFSKKSDVSQGQCSVVKSESRKHTPTKGKAEIDSSDEDSDQVNFFSFVDKNDSQHLSDESTSHLNSENSSIPAATIQNATFQPQTYNQLNIVANSAAYTSVVPSQIYLGTKSSNTAQPHQYYQTNVPPPPYESATHQNPSSISASVQEPGVDNSWQDDERFKRLQGKKGRKEKVEFIEINADSALDGNKELLLKQISEEKNLNRTSHSKRNKDMPSSTSRRKHQMSYLIHQAREREVELKNAWASGHAARMAARNRYGF
ncbi:proline-rich protein PRCC-like [Clavelina lepadiformis]